MRKRPHADIQHIALENFQSLKERAEISLRPLTFLYGPNSAGKSSIYDALTFVDAFFNGAEIEVAQYIDRWQHRDNTNNKITRPFTPMIVEVTFNAFGLFTGHFGGHFIQSRAPSEYWQAGITDFMDESVGPIDVRIELKSSKLAPTLYDDVAVTVAAKGLKLLSISLSMDDDGTPDDEGYQLEIFPSGFGEIIKDLAKRHGVDENHPRLCEAQCFISHAPFTLENHFNNSTFDHDLIAIANHILACIGWFEFSPKHVNADRTVIADRNLSAIVSTNGYFALNKLPPNFIKTSERATQSLTSLSTGTIRDLMNAKFEAERKLRKRQDCTDNEEIDSESTENEPSREFLHDYVNRCLSEHLFLDHGYQVKFDVCEILPPLPTTENTYPAALIVSSLIDNTGRCMTFEDVGTGISCVLPVLVALASWHSFIQQPELHLHPALQSALGDVLAEASHRSIHIIETHSEYILLRCLRRIRETTLGKHASVSPIALSADDVSVLYFDPQSDGTTKIKRLRVSTQGDFIDRWPRGFFDERGKDLFDE